MLANPVRTSMKLGIVFFIGAIILGTVTDIRAKQRREPHRREDRAGIVEIKAWWTPPNAQLEIAWEVGDRHGIDTDKGATINAPWRRGSVVYKGQLAFAKSVSSSVPLTFARCKVEHNGVVVAQTVAWTPIGWSVAQCHYTIP